MNKIDIKEIIKNTIDGDTYTKAYEVFSNKKIILKCRRNEKDEDVYEGMVSGMGNKSYPVSATIDAKGKVIHASCDCDFYWNYDGYCKHILAFLLKINEVTNKKEVNQLTSLLNFYKKSVSLDIQLTPIFHIYGKEVGIELKIGKGKTYFIKNIPEFFDNIEKNLSFKYGKELEFVHTTTAFNKESRNLIEDLKDYIGYRSIEGKSYFDNKRKCSLPQIVFKKCLDAHLDQSVELVLDEANYELNYTSSEFDLNLVFEKNTLFIENKKQMRVFMVGRSYYVIRDKNLYCLDNVNNPHVVPLVIALFQQDLVFNSKLYNEFFTYIYPQVVNCITIINKEEFEKYNNCSNLDAECYLDFKNHSLYLKYKFMYHSLEREEAIKQGYFPNIAQEENFFEQLATFSFLRTTKENEYIIDDEDWALDFLKNDLHKLKEYATVYISDSIKHLSFKKMNSTGVGIRFNNNWLELVFNEEIIALKDLDEILKSLKEKKKYHLLKDGTILDLQDKYIQDLKDIIETIGVPASKLQKEMQIPLFKMMRFESIFDQKAIPKEIEQFLYDLKNYKHKNYPLNPKLASVLRDYQKEGFRWLYNLAKYNVGGILADDMGLGKSLQIISLLSSFKTKNPNLIVAPSSLTYNWYNEFKKWDEQCDILLITGNGPVREQLIKNIQPTQTIITSYDYLKRDLELYQNLQFHFMVIDEAQNIKNFATKNAESVKEIKAITKFAVTGTPLENSLADLWSIFDYCLPGYLKTYEIFKYEYEYDIVKFKDTAKINRLNKLVAPFILRRIKKDVLKELPDKLEQVVYAKMDQEQQQVYHATIEQAKKQIMENSSNKMYIFSMLTRLRQICCHPKLYLQDYQGESAKLNLTLDLVENSISGNHKILIFSQFTSMLAILQEELQKRNIQPFVLTGDTPAEKRYQMVEEFNQNPEIKVFLISLKAGGTGLNLTAADTVIHYDPWWNLSAENQASDRVHRIGQQKNVQILKVIVKDSVEEKILNLQMLKKDLFNLVIGNEQEFVSKLTLNELLSLFND